MMVEIRKLKPSITIRLPPKQVTDRNYKQNSEKKRTERRRRDFPPPTPQPTPCVLWQGSIDPYGYGRRKATRPGESKPQTIGVHRWIVETMVGHRLKPHQVIMHLCDNRLCYRYDHLRIGTIQENNADRDAKGRLVQVAQHMYGETNGKSRLTATQVEAIRAMHASGLTQKAIAEKYGVSRQAISSITRGKNWKQTREN